MLCNWVDLLQVSSVQFMCYEQAFATCHSVVVVVVVVVKVKVKFSHTRYRALGPELILVYRQSARR